MHFSFSPLRHLQKLVKSVSALKKDVWNRFTTYSKFVFLGALLQIFPTGGSISQWDIHGSQLDPKTIINYQKI